MDSGATLFALSDPTRRSIVERLRARPASVTEVARGLPVSRPAVSQHLAVLKQSGLVTERRDGRRRVYRLEPRGLEPLRSYVEGLWSDVLVAYQRAAEAEAASGGESEVE
jgi:DNA-binding transcriptional ArsR family regulator